MATENKPADQPVPESTETSDPLSVKSHFERLKQNYNYAEHDRIVARRLGAAVHRQRASEA